MKQRAESHRSSNHEAITHQPPRRRLLSVLVAQALSVPMAAQAASVEVTSTADDGTECTLREAIASVNNDVLALGCANAGGPFDVSDEVTFAPSVSGGTITLTGPDIHITEDVAINPGGTETTIDGDGNDRIFFGETGNIDITLERLVLTGGDGVTGGGAIFVDDNVALTLENSTVSGNTAALGGGVFVSEDANVALIDSTVSENSADGGGGGSGGGIYANPNANVSLTDSTVSGNSAVDNGGGIGASVSANVTLMNSSTVSANSAGIDGGGIFAFDASVSLTNSTVSGNTAASFGGGIDANSNANVNLAQSTVSGSSALNGGGIAVGSNASVALMESTVSGNSATDDGGGIIAGGASVTLENSTVSGNTATEEGGGIFAFFDASVILTNSTVSSNTATSDGGGIDANNAGVILVNSTVSGNTAAAGGGVYGFNTATVTLTNSILADSQGGVPDCDKDAGSTVTALTDSIIDDDACGTGALNEAPGLLPLAANGGPTETHALKPGSPAIDAGEDSDCGPGLTIETDQRGVARDDGACDIGAYEFAETVTPIAFQDRAMGAVMNGADQWYVFNSGMSQRVSIQTNGFVDDAQTNGLVDDTQIELYTGGDPKQATNLLADDDDSGPELFSNIREQVEQGNHLIRVIGNPEADPFFLRLMSAEDILDFTDTGGHFAATAIRVMSAAGITGGCGQGRYCPNDPVTRAQMALFMLRAIQGGNQSSPAATGNVFGDVGPNSFGANAIEEFSTLGITAGCGGGNYCPDDPVTREQMAVFLLRALFGAGHTPPQATPAEIDQFSDIADSFARDWIVQLVDEEITGGCGDGNQFCPTDPVTRGQMAAFIQRTFDLDTEL